MNLSRHTIATHVRQQWMGVTIGVLAMFVALDGPVLAQDATERAAKQITGKQIKDRSIKTKDLSKATIKKLSGARGPTGVAGPAGPAGPPGPSGDEATPAEVLAKLLQVDGTASGLDADLLDGLSSAAFAPLATTVSDGDSAGGDLIGTYPGPQLGAGVVGGPEIAADAVTASKVAPDSLSAADLANNAIGTSELQSGSVTLTKMHSGGTQSITIENQGSIAGDTCVYFTRTNTAADQGELVIPEASPNSGTSLHPSLYFVPSVVTSDDVVGLTLCNYSGSAVDTDQYALSYRIVAVS